MSEAQDISHLCMLSKSYNTPLFRFYVERNITNFYGIHQE